MQHKKNIMKTTLLEKISSIDNLYKAWGTLRKRKSSHGLTDEETIEIFQKNLDSRIKSISLQLREQSYQFSSYRPVLIPKDNGGFRPLQIPEISDRLVLKALAIEIEGHFKDILDANRDVSFAYQTDLGIKNAVYKILSHKNRGNNYVLEADLINFYGNVKKNTLINTVLQKLPDNSLDNLIVSALNQTVGELDLRIDKDKHHYFDGINDGIPQGNSLSPLLSNIYLAPFDKHMKEKGYNLVRYADDFVVLCPTEKRCNEAYLECQGIFDENELNLPMHKLNIPDKGKIKTQILNIKSTPLSFLSITFDDKSFYPSRKNVEDFKEKLLKEVFKAGKIDIHFIITKIKNKLDGWISAFHYTNVDKYSKEIDVFIDRQLYRSLRDLGWRLTTSSLGRIPKKFRTQGESPYCLSKDQRKNSGVPFCDKLIEAKRKIAPEDIISEL